MRGQVYPQAAYPECHVAIIIATCRIVKVHHHGLSYTQASERDLVEKGGEGA